MKRILATAALVSLLAACTSATEDSPTTDDAPDTNTSAEPDVEEPETTDPESPDNDESESPDDTDSDSTDEPEGDGFGSMGDEEDVDFSEFTIESSESEAFPDLLGSFLPINARVGGHEGYDRVVVEYDGGEGQLEWGAGYTDTPTQDGSGFTIEMDGETFLSLSVSGVRYPEESEMDGEIVVSGLDQSSIIADVQVDLPFEGMHSIHVGVDEQRPYRVQTFYDPARIVIDFQNDN